VAQPIDIVEIYNNFRAIPYGIATLHGQFTAHRRHWNPNVLAGTKYHVAAADLLGQLAGGGLMFGLRRNFRSQLVAQRYRFAIRGVDGGI
jgi:hypothetical protein